MVRVTDHIHGQGTVRVRRLTAFKVVMGYQQRLGSKVTVKFRVQSQEVTFRVEGHGPGKGLHPVQGSVV